MRVRDLGEGVREPERFYRGKYRNGRCEREEYIRGRRSTTEKGKRVKGSAR